MDEELHRETVPASITRRMAILGLTPTEWTVIGLLAGQVLVYTERIPRKLGFLKFSHALFLLTALALYFGVLASRVHKPPRYFVHALEFMARQKYWIARGLREPKVSYWKD